MSNYILKMENITKQFPGVMALNNVDFHVKRGEVRCLVGANGAGKSTLMKVLTGAYTHDSGNIVFNGRVLKNFNPFEARCSGISMVYQELSLTNELSVLENVFLNNYIYKKPGIIDWKKTELAAKELAQELNINIDLKKNVSDLSIGQRQLVELMKCIAQDSKLIIMDEPSATLSDTEFKILVKTIKDLKKKGLTIIYISHRLEELFLVGDSISVMKDGKDILHCGINEIDLDGIVNAMVGKQIRSKKKSQKKNVSANEVVLEVKGVCTEKLDSVDLTLYKGEIHGLYGLVGAGRTELLRAIYGVDSYYKGQILYKGIRTKINSIAQAIDIGIGLLPENRKTQGLVLGLPVFENIGMVALHKYLKYNFIDYRKVYKVSKDYVSKLGIKTPTILTETRNLSGGNQQKVVIAKWLAENSKVLLVDEPTQGVDVGAKEEIYQILKDSAKEGKTVCIASSELGELINVCDTITVMFGGKVVRNYKVANVQEEEFFRRQ